MKKQKTITFIDNKTGQKFDFNIIEGTSGPAVVNVSEFYQKTGLFIYDPGFTSTASCQSEITFINGEKGELLHRGYNIEELAKKHEDPY